MFISSIKTFSGNTVQMYPKLLKNGTSEIVSKI